MNENLGNMTKINSLPKRGTGEYCLYAKIHTLDFEKLRDPFELKKKLLR